MLVSRISGVRSTFTYMHLKHVWRRTLIDIPAGNKNRGKVTVKPQRELPASKQANRLLVRPYSVPKILVQTKEQSGIIPVLDSKQVMNNLSRQLGLKCELADKRSNDIIQVPVFPEKTPAGNIEPIIPIPKFTFNAEDYPITEKELRMAPHDFPGSKYGYVTAETRPCTEATKLKGVNQELYMIGLGAGVARSKAVYRCKYFTLAYWDSSHYLAKIRKSKPAVLIFVNNSSILNTHGIGEKIPADMQSSFHPFKLSVNRNRYRKLLRKSFMKFYLADDTLVKEWDGLYRFSCDLFPVNDKEIEDFDRHLSAALGKVKQLDVGRLKREAHSANKSIPWSKVHKICRVFGLPLLRPE